MSALKYAMNILICKEIDRNPWIAIIMIEDNDKSDLALKSGKHIWNKNQWPTWA